MSEVQLREMLADAGLEPSARVELRRLLDPLARRDVGAPAPSAELAALLGDEAAPVPTDAAPRMPEDRVPGRGWRIRTAAAGVAVLAVSGVGATGLSAAANTLPRVVQLHVSQFSHRYLPFDLPEPHARHPRSRPLGHAPVVQDAGSQRRGWGDSSGADTSRDGHRTGDVVGPGTARQGSTDPVDGPTRSAGQAHAAAPSATPAPSAAQSPSSAQGSSSSSSQDRPASATPSPGPGSSPSGDPRPGQGRPGAKPGTGEDPPPKGSSPGKSPGTSPGTRPGKGPVKGPGQVPVRGPVVGQVTVPGSPTPGGDGSGQGTGGAADPGGDRTDPGEDPDVAGVGDLLGR